MPQKPDPGGLSQRLKLLPPIFHYASLLKKMFFDGERLIGQVSLTSSAMIRRTFFRVDTVSRRFNLFLNGSEITRGWEIRSTCVDTQEKLMTR